MNLLNSIEEQIIDSLKIIEQQLILERRGPNTEEIFEILGDLGQSNYDVASGKFKDKFDNQWLFDLIWYDNDESGHLISIPLIVESELKLDLINHKVDFEKLLVSNADNRLFICQAYTDDIKSRFKYFQEGIDLYKLNKEGDNYLIVIFDYYTHELVYKKLLK